MKEFDIYIGGVLFAQNISMEEKDAAPEKLLNMLKDVSADESDRAFAAVIENGAVVEFKEV